MLLLYSNEYTGLIISVVFNMRNVTDVHYKFTRHIHTIRYSKSQNFLFSIDYWFVPAFIYFDRISMSTQMYSKGIPLPY